MKKFVMSSGRKKKKKKIQNSDRAEAKTVVGSREEDGEGGRKSRNCGTDLEVAS